MEGKYDRAILNTLCAIAENLNPSGPAAVTFDYEPVCTTEGMKVLEVNSQTGAQRLLNLGGTVNTTASVIQCSSGEESDPVEICAGGVAFTMWVAKSNGVPTGTVYYTNAAGLVVPDPSPYQLGKCNSGTVPGLELFETVGAGTYAPPFTADCVTVSWDVGLIGSTQEIVVTLNGAISGNKTFKVYANNQEQICFNSPVITSVVIPALPLGSVDIEFKAK